MGCQSVCTSLAAQGKVNSSGGHSLICNAWSNLCKRATMLVTSHNQWYLRDWERERERIRENCQLCCSLLSCSFLSLSISPSFYQHSLRRRSLLALTVVRHSLNSWPVLPYFSLLGPAKTKNIKTKKRKRWTVWKTKLHGEKTKRKHGGLCAILRTLPNHAIGNRWSPFLCITFSFSCTELQHYKHPISAHKGPALVSKIWLHAWEILYIMSSSNKQVGTNQPKQIKLKLK